MGPSTAIPRLVAVAACALLLLLLGAALLPEEKGAPEALRPRVSPTVLARTSRTPRPTGTPRPSAAPMLTAGPARIRPGMPAEAVVEQGGLTFTMSLPSDTMLAGSAVEIQLRVQNDTDRPVEIRPQHLLLLVDEYGEYIKDTEYWWLRQLDIETADWIIGPREEQQQARTFYVPHLDREQHLFFWTRLYVADGERNLSFENGPLPVTIIKPRAEQQIVAKLATDEQGWAIQVLTPTGSLFSGKLYMTYMGDTNKGLVNQHLDLTANRNGRWEGLWPDWDKLQRTPTEIPLIRPATYLDALITAPGLASAVITHAQQTGEPTPTPAAQARSGTDYATLEEAQQSVDDHIFALGPEVTDARLEQITIARKNKSRSFDSVTQHYSLPDLKRSATDRTRRVPLKLSQMVTSRGSDVCKDRHGGVEGQAVQIGETAGCVFHILGKWYLYWDIPRGTISLQAPMSRFELAELLALAQTVR